MAYKPLAYACEDPDFDVWLSMKAKDLSQYGCVKEHVELEIAHRNSNSEAVIKIARKLRINKFLDKPSLEREAEAFYKIGRFQEALDARIASLTEPKKCEVFVDCPWEFTDATLHYENAKFYRAAGYLYQSEEELKTGDLEFDKICPRSGKNSNYCITLYNRLTEYLIIRTR